MITGLWLLLACGDSATDKENVEQTAQQTTPTTTQKSQQQNRPIPPSLNNGTKQNGPPGLPGSSTTEDLTDSWKTTLLSLRKKIWDQNLLTVLTMTVMDL